jgi:hypothetical protein
MALCAATAVVAGSTFAAIRWLATLGVVRVYEVEHVTGVTGDGLIVSSQHTYERALGLPGGPSRLLTDLDTNCWKVALVAGGFWMLRLALRAAGYRIGGLRGLGFVLGLVYFVAAGAMHRTTEAIVRPGWRRRTDVLITASCVALVAGYIALTLGGNDTGGSSERPGDYAVEYVLPWTMVGNGLLCFVAAGGIALAIFLTVSWWTAPAERRAQALLLARKAG